MRVYPILNRLTRNPVVFKEGSFLFSLAINHLITKIMWPKWVSKLVFGEASRERLIKLVKEEGNLVGERERNGRKVYTYLLKDFFVQVMFRSDHPSGDVEYLEKFEDLIQLNRHLEKEFKSAF